MKNKEIIIKDLGVLSVKRLIVDTVVFLVILISVFLLPSVTNAEMHVYSYDAQEDWVWTKENSPYVLDESLYIPSGYSLTVEGGVEIKSSKDSDTDEFYSMSIDGKFAINGSKYDPVKVIDVPYIYFSNNSGVINNTEFDGVGLQFRNSSTTLDSVKIKNTFEAVTAVKSRLNIINSYIANSTYGVFSKRYSPEYQVKSISGKENFGMGGDGDITLIDPDPMQNMINIKNSSIVNTSSYKIINQTTNPVDARDNWWSTPSGPVQSDNSGLVITEPWLTDDPVMLEHVTIGCCSNVLFLPGFEASRLYTNENMFGGTTTNQLWEPNTENDVYKLHMDSDGESVDLKVYAKDVMLSAYKIPGVYDGKGVYESFAEAMDKLVSDGKINKWLPYAYDWRKSPLEIVDGAFVQQVIDLANNSKTKKISIISHSNGGLVSKVLVKKLEEMGRGDIVDNLILVAVPELGTSSAIPALLHGYNQSLVYGILPTEGDARVFGQNLPGAYNLIPSKQFFQNNPINIISNLFSSSTMIASTYDSMKNFILDGPFSVPSSMNLYLPLKLNSKLLSLSDSFHSIFDKWLPPSTTRSLSILGWGTDTVENIQYSPIEPCLPQIFVCRPQFSIGETDRGDGTVTVDAGSQNMASTEYLNLDQLATDNKGKYTHPFIFEFNELVQKLKDIVTGETAAVKDYNKYFSSTEPTTHRKYLKINIHSPLDIDVYDKEGRHTGPIPASDPRSKYYNFEDNIILSTYVNFDGRKYVSLPYSPDEQYKIDLTGTGVGLFYVDVAIQEGEKILASTTFPVMPVTEQTRIDFVIATSTKDLASSTSMYMDNDADGEVDYVSRTNEFLGLKKSDPIANITGYLEIARKIILSFKLNTKEEKKWLSRIDKISKANDKNQTKKMEKIMKKISMKKIHSKIVTEGEKAELLKTFDLIFKYLESKS